jgi:hypothetical protein
MTTIVKINGARPDAVLSGLTITYGRQKSEGEFPASTCSLSLLATDVAPLTVNVRDVVTVETDGVMEFYGRVTDRQTQISYSNTTHIGTVQNIIATGVLADFGRIKIGSSVYPSELDGARASRVIAEAAPTPPTIDAITSTITSVNYSIDVYRSTGLDTIDAGTVTLISRASNVRTPREIINEELDPQAPGVYETTTGTIGYADAMRRPKASSPIVIPKSVISTQMTISSGISDIVNQAVVTYGSPSATVTQDEPLSQSIFGVITRDVSTQLANTSDANNLAKRLVETRSVAEDNIEALVIDLENPSLSGTLRTQLLAPAFGKPIRIDDLDARIGIGTSWRGFIEGWQMIIAQSAHVLTLYVSARKFSIPLSTIDPIYVNINNLTGSIDDLADLWSSQLTINFVSDTINSVVGTYDSAYTIGT